METVKVGQKVRFDPFKAHKGYGVDFVRCDVTGTVVEVYQAHTWFSVVYGNPPQRISFKFSDIGKDVTIIG